MNRVYFCANKRSHSLVTMRHALRQILNGSPYVPEFMAAASPAA